MKRASLIIIIIINLIVLLFYYRPRAKQLTTYKVEASEVVENGELTVQFLGNTNLLFSDGTNSILTDGFFSRPPIYKLLFGKVEPNKKVIKACLDKAGISGLDAVIPVHSHFDHVMDAPVVAEFTGAKLIGSLSTANVGKGYGLNEFQIVTPELNSPFNIGKFKITLIKSRHWQYPDAEQRKRLLDCEIETPLITPASIYDYKEGDSYTILIEHGSTKIAIQGSAGFKAGSLPDFDADILFMAIAGLEMMDETYVNNYQNHLIEPLNPEILVPIHWDDFSTPLTDELKTTNLLVKLKMGTNLGKAFEEIENRNLPKNRKIKVLPVWKKVSVNDLIER